MERAHWDAVIVGAGPAGLSAALVLGRCRRTVLVCDAGEPRNAAARAMHAFITRDGTPPSRMLRLARDELAQYPDVTLLDGTVTRVRRQSRRFAVQLADGQRITARKLLLATGVTDDLPRLSGIERFYGHTVHLCPYCDGWEARDEPIAVYGRRSRAFEMARSMTAFSRDIVVCSNGASGLRAEQKRQLARNGVTVNEQHIARLVGRGRRLQGIEFADGTLLRRSRLFFDTPSHARSQLQRQLGCSIRPDGSVHCSGYEATDVPGVFVAGNVAGDVQLVIFAAAEGAKAAFGINRSLTREDFERRATGRRIVEHPTGEADA
jgi:thioredoxin reductase